MSAHPPPIPPDQQAKYGGETDGAAAKADVAGAGKATVNDTPDQKGQAGNTKQNTTNKGLQQDR